MKLFKKKYTVNFDASKQLPSAIKLLESAPGLWQLDEHQRSAMTISCHDTDYIPKVKNAGSFKKTKGSRVQVMHNGIVVQAAGYHGDWMGTIITSLNGHHEPQEEKVFYETLKRLGQGSTMIELGSFWAYYSVWFNKQIKGAVNICCEPDPHNMLIGKKNAELNDATITFLKGAAGSMHNAQTEVVMDSDNSKIVTVPILSIDGLVKQCKLKRLDLVHMDVQGFELSALEGAINSIKTGKIRFLFVSTHHYFFSNDPNTHGKCLQFIKERGGHIVTSHTIAESYSGDGLIVASFAEEDKDFTVTTSINHTDRSLFRPYEVDLAILAGAYDQSKA